MPEVSSFVVSNEVISECVTFTYGTLRQHGNSIHELGPLLEHSVPVDSSSPRSHVVRYIHDHSVSKAHLKNTKILIISGWTTGSNSDRVIDSFRPAVQAGSRLRSASKVIMTRGQFYIYFMYDFQNRWSIYTTFVHKFPKLVQFLGLVKCWEITVKSILKVILQNQSRNFADKCCVLLLEIQFVPYK
jgi:hypothetical protein